VTAERAVPIPNDLGARVEAALLSPASAARSRGLIVAGTHVLHLRELTSGASGVTVTAVLRRPDRDRRVVVKAIAPGLDATRHRDLGRQVRVLRALRGETAVPVPGVLAFDAGDPPRVAPLYVMDFVEGDTFDPTNPGSLASSGCPPDVVATRAHASMRILADLQRLDTRSLGEAPLRLGDELARWERAFSTTSGAHVPLSMAIAARLRERIPGELAPALVHGDFRLGNLLFQDIRPVAVLDWEIWSVSDPRLDLGWFVARAYRGHPSRPADRLGFPAAEELIKTYSAASGLDVPDLGWFVALAAFKHAAASALIDKRSSGGAARDPDRVGQLLRWAAAQLAHQ
jgi:aminoglycoside phosphotransferase (APT) family kinase protein